MHDWSWGEAQQKLRITKIHVLPQHRVREFAFDQEDATLFICDCGWRGHGQDYLAHLDAVVHEALTR